MLTLITATLNAAAFLERAIASTASPDVSIQHLVIDGGSTDRTADICRAHPSIDLTVRPGCSIYEAWNIGLEKARGGAVMFLNADDEFMPDTARRVEAAFAEHHDADIVAGHADVISDASPASIPITHIAAPHGRLDVGELAVGVPAINAMAFRRTLFERFGRFETRYRVAGDRAFLLRVALAATPPVIFNSDAVLYRYHAHAGSLTLSQGLGQRLRIARDHLALSRVLLRQEMSGTAALWLRHMRQREAAVATLRCLAARRPIEACEFVTGLWS